MNIIGSGLIASAFRDQDFGENITCFASGVSNSNELRESEFIRESDLLNYWLNRSQKLLYFSTCSVDDESLKNSLYVSHKIKMEELVLSKSENVVIRLPQVVGKCKNKYTLTNFIASKIYHKESYDLYDGVLRNLIDIVDVVTLTKYLFDCKFKDNLYSFAMPVHYEVAEVVGILQSLLNQPSLHRSKKGVPVRYPESDFVKIAIDNQIISCGPDYLENVLGKYYSNYPDEFPDRQPSLQTDRGIVN